MKRIKTLVVDDHPLLRKGVVDILSEDEDIEVVGEAADGAQAVEMARVLIPQVVILDLQISRWRIIFLCPRRLLSNQSPGSADTARR